MEELQKELAELEKKREELTDRIETMIRIEQDKPAVKRDIDEAVQKVIAKIPIPAEEIPITLYLSSGLPMTTYIPSNKTSK